jgi:hypothetical protein
MVEINQKDNDTQDKDVQTNGIINQQTNNKIIDSSNISLAFESSLVLKGTKYMKNKSKLEICFLKYSPLNVVKAFFITVTKQISPVKWFGYDSSCRCILETNVRLVPLKRYEVYGRLRKTKYLIVEVLRIYPINYKDLIYQVL